MSDTVNKTPLNGTRTHPLTPHAIAELRTLRQGPRPAQEINPGVRDRFEREGLVETVSLDSPYKTRKGKVPFLRLSDAGRARLAEIDAARRP